MHAYYDKLSSRFSFIIDRKLRLKFIGCPLQCIVSYGPHNEQQQGYLVQVIAGFFQNFAFLKQRKIKGGYNVFLWTLFWCFLCSEEELRDILINLHKSSGKVCYFLQSLDKTEFGFNKTPNIHFPANPCSGSRAVAWGQTVSQIRRS